MMVLKEVPFTTRSVAGECSRCGDTIGVDEQCYIELEGDTDVPMFVGNDATLVCTDCAE